MRTLKRYQGPTVYSAFAHLVHDAAPGVVEALEEEEESKKGFNLNALGGCAGEKKLLPE